MERSPLCSCLELAGRAATALKAVGFEYVTTSMKSEATYYRLPGRHGVLRIATHQSKREPIGLDEVVATITFRGGWKNRDQLHCTDIRFENMIWIAVGQYIMRSAVEHDSNYCGKRGTWETAGGPTVENPDRPYCKSDQSCCDFACGN